MANVALFRSGQTAQYLLSVETSAYVSDSDAIINPDVSAVIAIPLKYWKRSGALVLEMSAAEKTAVDDAATTAALTARRAIANAVKDLSDDDGIKWRALALILIDELNILRAAVPRAIVSITRSGTTATVTTRDPHGLTTGDTVAICGATAAAYNLTTTITVVTSTTFTYSGVSGNPTTPAAGSLFYALGVVPSLNPRTLAPLKTAYANKINAGSAD